MKSFLEYSAYRVLEYFSKKGAGSAIQKAIYFIVIFEISFLVPLSFLARTLFKIDSIFPANNKLKYQIGIPLALLMIWLNNLYFKTKLSGIELERIAIKYKEDKYRLPVWIIFSVPVINVFVTPMIYGLIKGTLHFPIFE